MTGTSSLTLHAVVGRWIVDPADPLLRTEFGDVVLTIAPTGEAFYVVMDPGAALELHAIIVEEGGRLWLEGQPGSRSPIRLTDDGKLTLDDGIALCTFVRAH